MKPHNLQLHGQLSLLLCNIGMVCWNYDILYNDGKIPKPKWIIYVRTLVMIKFDCRRIEHTKYESPFLKTRRLALCTSFWICTAHDTVGSGHLSPGSSDWRRAWSASRSPLSWTPAPLEKPPLVCVAITILNKNIARIVNAVQCHSLFKGHKVILNKTITDGGVASPTLLLTIVMISSNIRV